MYRRAARINGETAYWKLFNNSNTFLRRLMQPCGIWVDFPTTAVASGEVSDDPISDSNGCIKRCLNGKAWNDRANWDAFGDCVNGAMNGDSRRFLTCYQ